MFFKYFLNIQDWSCSDFDVLFIQVVLFKCNKFGDQFKGKLIVLVFFNLFMCICISFEFGVFQFGVYVVVLQLGKDVWLIEFNFGMVMDGDIEEYIVEVVKVLGCYCDIIVVCVFFKFIDWVYDCQDIVFNSFVRYLLVLVINMEIIIYLCQELVYIMVLQEYFGIQDLCGKKYVLIWIYYFKLLNIVVVNLVLIIVICMGMDVILLCLIVDYIFDDCYMGWVEQNVVESGGLLKISYDIDSVYVGVDVVYVKSWGVLLFFGNWELEKLICDQFKYFIVDECKMVLINNGVFSYCFLLCCNVKVIDVVMDLLQCIVINEVENCLYVQKVIMVVVVGC